MRMWGVPVECLCNKHLCGEHVEMHMFMGTISKRVSLAGYVSRGLIEPARIVERHDALVAEMIKRYMNHKSPIVVCEQLDVVIKRFPNAHVDVEANLVELSRRCEECRVRIEKYQR